MNILEKVKIIIEDPITLMWQIHHTASILLETNFINEGEKLLRDILDEYFPINSSSSSSSSSLHINNPRVCFHSFFLFLFLFFFILFYSIFISLLIFYYYNIYFYYYF